MLSIPTHKLMVFRQLFALHYHHPSSAPSTSLIQSSRLLLWAIQKGTEIILSVSLYQLYMHLHIQCKDSNGLGVFVFKRMSDKKEGWTYRTCWVLTHALVNGIIEGSASQSFFNHQSEHTANGLNQRILKSYMQGKLCSRNCCRRQRISRTEILLPIHNSI